MERTQLTDNSQRQTLEIQGGYKKSNLHIDKLDESFEQQKQKIFIIDEKNESTNRRQSFQIQSPTKRFTNIKKIQQTQVPYKNLFSLFWKNVALCLSFFFFGYNLTSLSCLPEPVIENAYGVDVRNSAVKGFLIGCIPIGVCIGVIISPFFVVIFTRKNFLYIVNLIAFIFTCLLQVGNLYFCIVCRLFQGICFACYMQLIPAYINEITCSRITKWFANMPQFMIVLGVDVSYALQLIFQNTFDTAVFNKNPVTNTRQNQIFWRVIFAVTPVVLIFQTLLAYFNFIPQSPNSLLELQRDQEAKEIIAMFNKQQHIDDIIMQKYAQIAKLKVISQNTYDQELLHRFNDNPSTTTSVRLIFLGFSLAIMQQMNGITAVVTQAGGIITFYDQSLGQYTPIIITTVQLAATTFSIILINTIGIKISIMTGNLGMGIFDLINAIMFYFINWQPAVYIVLVGLIINMIIFGATIGNSVWIYVPSIMPPKLMPMTALLSWISCAICVVGMPIVMDAISGNPYPAFFFFAGWTLFFFVVNLILISFKHN